MAHHRVPLLGITRRRLRSSRSPRPYPTRTIPWRNRDPRPCSRRSSCPHRLHRTTGHNLDLDNEDYHGENLCSRHLNLTAAAIRPCRLAGRFHFAEAYEGIKADLDN